MFRVVRRSQVPDALGELRIVESLSLILTGDLTDFIAAVTSDLVRASKGIKRLRDDGACNEMVELFKIMRLEERG